LSETGTLGVGEAELLPDGEGSLDAVGSAPPEHDERASKNTRALAEVSTNFDTGEILPSL
jgi:hypothetical protein